jgi:PAS domain S-box-containing protein
VASSPTGEYDLLREALSESESRFRTLFENSPLPLMEIDLFEVKKYLDHLKSSGTRDPRWHFERHPEEIQKCLDLVKVIDANHCAIKLLGVQSREALKGNFAKFFTKESLLPLKNQLLAVYSNKSAYEAEMVGSKLNGEALHALVRWNAAPGYEESLARVFVSISDISERKMMLDALMGSEAKNQVIFESAANFIATLNEEGAIVDCNGKVQDFLEYLPAEAIGKPISEFFHPEDAERVLSSLNEVKKLGFITHYEARMVCKDSSLIDVNVNTLATKAKNGKYDRIIMVIEDITERKKAQSALIWELAVNTALGNLYKPIISGSLTIAEIAARILEQAKYITGSEHGYVSQIVPETGDNLGHTLNGNKKGECKINHKGTQLSFSKKQRGVYESLWGHSLNTHIGFFTNMPDRHPSSRGAPMGHIPLKRFLSVPVLLGNELVGQIALANSHRDYSERDLEAVTRMGEYYALAIRRRRMEEELQESEDKYRRLVEYSTDGVVIIQDGKIVYINQAGAKTIGAKYPESIIGCKSLDFVHPDYQSILEEKVGRASRVIQPLLERKFTRLDGRVIDMEVTALPFIFKGKAAIQVIFRDITERKRMENELRTSKAKYQQLVELAYEGIWVLDVKDRTTFVNQRMSEMLGIPAEKILEKPIYDFIEEEGRKDAKENLELHKKGIKAQRDFVFMRQDGSRMHALLHTTPIFDEDGDFSGLLSLVTDITERKLMEERLRTENEKLELITSNLSIGVSIISRDYRTVWANSVMRNLFGEVEAQCCYSAIHNLDGVCVDCGLEKIFAGDPIHKHEQMSIDATGKPFWSQIITTPIKNSKGGVILALEIVIPITERKEAEEALQVSEAMYRGLFENMPDGLYQSSVDGKLLKVNDSLVKTLGYSTKDELLSVDIAKDLYANMGDREIIKRLLEEKGEIKNNELVLKRKDGNKITVLENTHVVKDKRGKTLYFEGALSDITERKRMEDELRRYSEHLAEMVEVRARELALSQAKFSKIIESSPDPIVVIEEDGRISECNQASIDLLSLQEKGQLIGRNYLEFVKECDRGKTMERMKTLTDTGHMNDVELDLITNGRDVPLSISVGLIQDKSLGPGSAVLIGKDMTQRKLAEKELRNLMEIREQFLSNISHELRTPLVSMMGYLDYILTGKLGTVPQKIQENLEVVKRNTDRLIRLTNDILDVKRIESGKTPLELEHLDLGALINDCVQELRPFILEKRQELKLEGLGHPLFIEGDRLRIHQVMTNLLSNASKFTPEGGSITVHVSMDGENQRVEISDNGMGIRKEDLDRVFEPFTAIKKITYVRGTGLGLSVTKGLIEAHGGRIWVESEGEGAGARFIFLLPKKIPSNGENKNA